MNKLENIKLTPTMFKHAMGFLELLESNKFTKVNGFTKISSEILNEHFRSNQTRHSVIKLLKDNGIIEVDGQYSIKNNIPKGYRLAGKTGIGIEPPIVLEDEFFTAGGGQSTNEPQLVQEVNVPMLPTLSKDSYSFSYKGMYEVTEVITKEDKRFAHDCCLKLGSRMTLHNFEVECIEKDWSREKMWFLYNKFQDKYFNKAGDGLFQ